VAAALELLADTPRRSMSWPSAMVIAAHRIPCWPTNERWSGHVDLGALGVADRWADLAVATVGLPTRCFGGKLVYV